MNKLKKDNIDSKEIRKNRVLNGKEPQDYSLERIQQRIEFLETFRNKKIKYLNNFKEKPLNYMGNIENLIGVTQVPTGIIGPVKIKGDYAKGDFYVPLATTEGAIISTYHYGANVVNKTEGISTKVLSNNIHISPAFEINNLSDAIYFIEWINTNFVEIKKQAESTTKHGILKSIDTNIVGQRVVVKFNYYTADAQGMNMINVATDFACKFISNQTKKKFFIRSNFSSVKKISIRNCFEGYGRDVVAEVVLSKKILKMMLKVTPEQMLEQFHLCYTVSAEAGMLGVNAQASNAIAAIYLACGQDIADLSTSTICNGICNINSNGDLFASVHLSNLLIGTVGGGTGLGTQRECLEMIDCYGKDKADKLAEVIAAVVLCGEIATTAALANGNFIQAHATLGRNKPKED